MSSAINSLNTVHSFIITDYTDKTITSVALYAISKFGKENHYLILEDTKFSQEINARSHFNPSQQANSATVRYRLEYTQNSVKKTHQFPIENIMPGRTIIHIDFSESLVNVVKLSS